MSDLPDLVAKYGETAKDHLVALTTIPEDQLTRVLDIIEDKGSYEEITTGKFADFLVEAGFEVYKANAIRAILYNLSKIYTDEKKRKNFLRSINSSFDKDAITKITNFFSAVSDRGIIDKLADVSDKLDMFRSGISHLGGIKFDANYKVFTNRNSQKEIIPMVVCNLELHTEHGDDDPDWSYVQKVIFQCDLDLLDQVMTDIQTFRDKVLKEKSSLYIKTEERE